MFNIKPKDVNKLEFATNIKALTKILNYFKWEISIKLWSSDNSGWNIESSLQKVALNVQ